MFENPFAKFNLSKPFDTTRSRNLFGAHTTPREWKRGARDIPFGLGAKPLHVDGTNGHDSNDGESWITAKKTIQAAVDDADSWTQIFVRDGTYAENVSITDDSIHLIGQSRDSVDIHPVSGNALTISGDAVLATKLSLYSPAASAFCLELSGENLIADTIKLHGAAGAYGISLTTPNHSLLNNIYTSNSALIMAIYALGTAEHLTISNCTFNLTSAASGYIIYMENISKSRIFNNDLGALSGALGYGVVLNGTCADITISHNNFLSNTRQVANSSGSCKFFENYYSEHTNIDNGHGIATEPYSPYIGADDPRPVIVRNGWNSVSLLRSLLRKKTAAQTSQAAIDANGTSWVDLKTIAPTTSDVELHQLKMTVAGSWVGNAKYRVIVGSTKVYPFPADKNISTGVLESFIFPINVQVNETAKIQFRSDNAGDGAGDTVTLNQLDYATVL